ncbi:hypothetical protein HF521_022344 [Silurus meridionalis]|uniref:Uncharacterized protein n=1 Tax=Silurus meridionalis TaxID=175797 RepID=A0A8T0BC83_SILME|nr:hypothetical protein HF521_022344 [Silurus meridionalis]
MAIIRNANDFSNFSISTDDSSLNNFFTEIPETETIKGVYFQRAQLLRDPSALTNVDHSKLALVNVGGDRYTFAWSTLDDFPLSRLGQLRHCSSPEDIARLCDDYDEVNREFFFDRSATAFRVILNFLAAGKLRLLRQACAVFLSDELSYWGIEPTGMEHCCRRAMITCLDELAERKRKEEARRQKRLMKQPTREKEKGFRGFLGHFKDIVDNPHSGWLGKSFACVSVVMIAVTVFSLCISSLPHLREEESRGECSLRCQQIFIVETVCVVWFTLELLLRFLQARSKLEFARGPLNIIDAVAILPYYISLLVDERDLRLGDTTTVGGGYLDKLGLILRLMRALRILYVMRLARHSLGLQTLGLTVQRSMHDFGLLLLFVCVAVTLFSPLIHLTESERHGFSSIPACFWWAIISMTTVGYGDMVPRTIPGQAVAFSAILSGILIMAFPATSIFHVFSRSYRELRQEHEMMCKDERVALLTTEECFTAYYSTKGYTCMRNESVGDEWQQIRNSSNDRKMVEVTNKGGEKSPDLLEQPFVCRCTRLRAGFLILVVLAVLLFYNEVRYLSRCLHYQSGPEGREELQQNILQESAEHHDIIQSDFLDSYKNLTIKTMVMMEWLATYCQNADYAMKIDSDMFLNLNSLMTMLLKAPKENYITGLVANGAIVLRNPSSKWYLPKNVFPEDFYPPYALGLGYVFSLDLANKIIEGAKQVQAVYIEDVFLGLCMRHLGIPYTRQADQSLFNVFPVPYNRCKYSKLIATTTYNLQHQVDSWKDLKRPGPPC